MPSRAEFTTEFSLKPGLNWIHVVSAEGSSIGGATATSDDVTNPEDREFLFAMRSQSDAIFVSAKTALAENYRASKFAPIYVIDRNGRLDSTALASAATDSKQAVHLVGSVAEALAQLVDGKRSRILLESGRAMTAALLAEANSPVCITQALLTVTTQSSELATVRASGLLESVGANATVTKRLAADNVYLAFELQPKQHHPFT